MSPDQKLPFVKRLLMSFFFVLNSAFTSKDQYFQAALHEATTAFNDMVHSFGYTQKLEHYDPHQHQAHPPQQHPLYN